ncbi:DUF2442 domain-containing protein [Candidatus Electronema sp. PJ]|uniref:DUF2442 domain-containing protein n=1 Tax=Candidatus Electronema sp. PJ TaxID=3401572 RepID=UPI003AA810E8
MSHPKVRSVHVLDPHTLAVEFDNNITKRYDIEPLLDKEVFAPLANYALFKAVRVEPGGWAVSWNKAIDLSEHELWSRGQTIA